MFTKISQFFLSQLGGGELAQKANLPNVICRFFFTEVFPNET